MSQFTLKEEFEEANRELLECARYGEADDLEDLLVRGADCNYADTDTGNTPLHRAAANGEVECIKVLIKHKCKHVPNKQGNYPIHWAAQNGKTEALKLIFDHFSVDEVDVLKQNSFGRSTLTEAFSSKNTDCIEIVLSQPSASEDKLLPSGNSNCTSETVPMDEEEAASSEVYDEKNGISHSMYFTRGGNEDCVIQVRELPITRADNPFGTETNPEDDTTGLGVWPASILLSHYINTKRELIQGSTVVELGAGCGLPAIAAAKLCRARTVYLTDIHDSTLRNACYNVHLNKYNDNAQSSTGVTSNCVQYVLDEAAGTTCDINVSKVNWVDVSSYPPNVADVVLGSDLIYDKNILAILVPAIVKMLKVGGSFLYVAPALGNHDRAGLDALDSTLLSSGFECVESFNCPSEFYRNVLVPSSVVAAGSETGAAEDLSSMVDDMNDQFVLHFYDLSAMKPHTCHHYVRKM